MSQKPLEQLLDKRVVQRHITEGKISREEVEKHKANLKDLESECEDISESIEAMFQQIKAKQ